MIILVEMLKCSTYTPLYLISITRQVLSRYIKTVKSSQINGSRNFTKQMMHGKNVELLLQKTHQVDDSSTSDEPLVIFAQQNILCPKFFDEKPHSLRCSTPLY